MLFPASGLPRALIWMAYTRRDSLPGSTPNGKHHRKLAQERNELESPSQCAHGLEDLPPHLYQLVQHRPQLCAQVHHAPDY